MSKKQVTFADIAAYTHFSKTTISRYFNHPDSLTLENQEKISQALDTLGYKKNKLAKVLANGHNCCPATVIITTNFSSLAVNMGLKKNSNILKSSYPIRLKVSLF